MPDNIQKKAEGVSLLEHATKLKSIQDIGLSQEEDVKEYLLSIETLVENMARYLSQKEEGDTLEITALKNSVAEVARNIKHGSREVNQLTRDQIAHDIGKTMNAMARNDKKALFELKAFPQRARQKEDWDQATKWDWNPEKGMLEYKGVVQKADLGSPLEGDTGTGQYVINPIYERELIRQAAETSDMMSYVRHLPMLAPTHSWPVLASNGFTITWKSAYAGASAMYSDAGTPTFGARETMTAQTASGFIPWFDEFEDDMQLNTSLGELFMEAWASSYAEEFDKQCLTESANPFTGLLEASGILVHRVAGQAPGSIDLDDLVQAPLKIPRKERSGGYWIMNETVAAHLISKRNAIGDYLIWTPPAGEKPASIAYHPYIEARVMPEFGDVAADEAFIAYCVPNRRIWHGDRAGLEVKYFQDTSYALEYGELFVRFRKRDAFKIIQPELAVVIKTRA